MDASQANSMLNSFDEEMEDFELEVSHRRDPIDHFHSGF